jgi:diketogulonate reductase-like aldo/keto reductase
MSRRRFGPLPDEVPTVGQGTWQLGGRNDRAREIAALRTGIARGLTHIDTAEMYGSGLSEQIIAEAIADVPRRELFIVSKVLPQNASAAGTIRACEQSLARLRTDYLDVYLLHWRGSYPLAETFGAFQRLVDQGKIRSFGVSNFDIADLEEAISLVGSGRIACNQVLYHLRGRHIDAGLVEYCRERNIAVVAYSPFGHGKGSFPRPDSPGGRVLAEVAARHGATPRQASLAFLTRSPPLFTIPKASNPVHVEENADALKLTLSPADIAELDAAFPVRAEAELPSI